MTSPSLAAKTSRLASVAAVALIATGLSACGTTNERSATTSHESVPPDSSSALSLYDLELVMTDQDGHPHQLSELRGQPLVLAMIYTSCESICPRTTEDMKSIEKVLPDEELEQSRFVLFSLDPGRDTPEALRAFARVHRLEQSRWRLFATSEEGVLDLAAVLGVKHRREENGEIAHSAIIFVVDRDGVVRHQQLGLGADAKPLIEALRKVNQRPAQGEALFSRDRPSDRRWAGTKPLKSFGNGSTSRSCRL